MPRASVSYTGHYQCAGAGTDRREPASTHFLEFFAANIRNPHTRRAYGRAVAEFLAWC